MASNFTVFTELATVDHGRFITVCLGLPPKINSDGIWNSLFESSPNPTFSPLPLLELQMLVIFSVIMLLHFILNLFGLPLFVSQMIAGLVLGSSWRGSSKSLDKYKEYLFPIVSQDILGLVAAFGYILFVFLIGVRMDISAIKRTGKQSLIGAVLSIGIPAIIGLMAAFGLSTTGDQKELSNMKYLAAHHSYTSFAVVVYLLDHLKILNSEVGRLALSTTIVADMIGISSSFILPIFEDVRRNGALNASMHFASTIGSIAIVVFIFRRTMLWIVRSTPNGRPVQDRYICLVVLLVFVSCVTSKFIGRSVYTGSLILGMAVPEGPPLGASLVNKLEGIATSVFAPLFVTISVMKVDLSLLSYDGTFLAHVTIVILMTAIGKMVVLIGTCLYFKMSSNDALAFSLIMSTKGIVELISSSYFYDKKVLNEQNFAVVIVDIFIFSILMPMLVKRVYDPSRKYTHYKKHNILNLKPNAELSILGCFHTQDDVPILLNLLDASCPMEESHISLYALHLVELVGRAAPVFISHELHDQKSSSADMVSSNIIQMIYKYERMNEGVVSIEAFTAIAPMKLMHDDICNVAVNKLTSLVILPFHRRWTREGFVDSEDNTIRSINCNVLERAPCSVGILIDRGNLSTYHSFERSFRPILQVAVVFIGGRDDREAFSFASRMVKEVSTVQLTVVRLIAEDESINHWEMVLDTELLNDVKHSFVGNEPFRYVERRAEDGSETAAIVRSVGDEYDLVIVGRRCGIESPQTSGLMEWNEFPELGIIGDMFASSDFHCKASTLVVQQQQQPSL